MKEYITYKGSEFTIEWYHDVNGRAQALEHFKKQPKDKQRKALNLFRLMGDQGKIFDETKFRNEGDKIYAFKPPTRPLFVLFLSRKKKKSSLLMLLQKKARSSRREKKS